MAASQRVYYPLLVRTLIGCRYFNGNVLECKHCFVNGNCFAYNTSVGPGNCFVLGSFHERVHCFVLDGSFIWGNCFKPVDVFDCSHCLACKEKHCVKQLLLTDCFAGTKDFRWEVIASHEAPAERGVILAMFHRNTALIDVKCYSIKLPRCLMKFEGRSCQDEELVKRAMAVGEKCSNYCLFHPTHCFTVFIRKVCHGIFICIWMS